MITLTEVTLIRARLERVFDLARSIDVHLAGNVHYGEQAVAVSGSKITGLLEFGDTVTWRARHLRVRQKLTSKITAYKAPFYFQDTMVRGAFSFMQHSHHFRVTRIGRTEMRDVFRFAAPLPLVGRMAEKFILRDYMEQLLRERNAAIKQIAESPEEVWRHYLGDCDFEPNLAATQALQYRELAVNG